MADLREIKAVKTQIRLEKVALDAQIRQALLASEALANQVRAMHERRRRKRRKPRAQAVTLLTLLMGVWIST